MIRVAVYYAPRTTDPLFTAGATWLGRDPVSDAPAPQPDLPGIADVTAEPSRYGLHATLKPPMRLRPGIEWAEIRQAASELAEQVAAFDLPPLAVADVLGFLALRETAPCLPLQALADLCVADLDRFRAAPEEEELERRRRIWLSAAQDALLRRWGYPFVFGAWFFHMTLTRRLSPAEHARWLPAAELHFASALGRRRRVDTLCLFTQSAPDRPFLLTERLKLRA